MTKDGILQGVVDIVELIHSNNISNVPQVGQEFGCRFRDITERIFRINAGEDAPPSTNHPVSSDSGQDLSLNTSDCLGRTSSSTSSATEAHASSPTKDATPETSRGQNKNDAPWQQTVAHSSWAETSRRVETVDSSSQHRGLYPAYSPHVNPTDSVVRHHSQLPKPSSHTQVGSGTLPPFNNGPQPMTFAHRLYQSASQRRRGLEGVERTRHVGTLAQFAQLPPPSYASLPQPQYHARAQEVPCQAETTGPSRHYEPVPSLNGHQARSVDLPRPLEPPMVFEAESATSFNRTPTPLGYSMVNNPAEPNDQRNSGNMHGTHQGKANYVNGNQSHPTSNSDNSPQASQRRPYDHFQQQSHGGQRELIQDRRLRDSPSQSPSHVEELLDLNDAEVYLRQRGVRIPQQGNMVTVEIDPNDFNGSAHVFAGGKSYPSDAREVSDDQGFQRRMSNPGPLDGHHPDAARAATTVHPGSITPMFTDGTATGAADTGSYNPNLCPAIPVHLWSKERPGRASLTIDISRLFKGALGSDQCMEDLTNVVNKFAEMGERTVSRGQLWAIRPMDIDLSLKIASNFPLPQSQRRLSCTAP